MGHDDEYRDIHPDDEAEREAEEWQHRQDQSRRVEPTRRLCPDCRGTGLDYLTDSGGSCPSCYGGYLR